MDEKTKQWMESLKDAIQEADSKQVQEQYFVCPICNGKAKVLITPLANNKRGIAASCIDKQCYSLMT
jgi:transcription elongation factor Elf1